MHYLFFDPVQLYARLKSEHDMGSKFKKMVSRREGIEAFGGTTKASVEGTTHTVRQEELTAFSLWINRYMGAL